MDDDMNNIFLGFYSSFHGLRLFDSLRAVECTHVICRFF